MSRRKKIIFFSFAATALVAVGYLADVVGNIGIRRVGPSEPIQMNMSLPVIPGAPVQVRWSLPDSFPDQAITIGLRAAGGDILLAQGNLSDEKLVIVVPCKSEVEDASIVMQSQISAETISWLAVEIMPPGPDCV